MKKNIRLCLVLLAILTCLCACESDPTDISVSSTENEMSETPPSGEVLMTVNTATKRIHLDPNCHHVASIDKENLRHLAYTSDNVNTLISMGYSFCSVCEMAEGRLQSLSLASTNLVNQALSVSAV